MGVQAPAAFSVGILIRLHESLKGQQGGGNGTVGRRQKTAPAKYDFQGQQN